MRLQTQRMCVWLARGLVAAATMLASTALARAQDYPNRTIQAFIGFPAGSGADIMCRFFTTRLTELAGQPVVIVNKPGAFGSISYSTVAPARPDGYTMLMAGNVTFTAGQGLVKALPYDYRSFVPVATIAQTPFVMTVSASSPARSMSELVALLKAKPKARYGTNNPGNVVGSAWLRQLTGFVAEPVNYRSGADAIIDLDNGTLDFMIFDGAFAIGHIKSAKLRALAATSAGRIPALPDVLTMQQAGIAELVMNPWWGAYFPLQTPQPIVDKMAGWVRQISASPEAAKFFEPLVVVPITETSEQMTARLAADSALWSRLIKLAGIEPQ